MHGLFDAIYVHCSRILIDMVYAKWCFLAIFRALDFGPLPHESYRPELLSMSLPGYANGKIHLFSLLANESQHGDDTDKYIFIPLILDRFICSAHTPLGRWTER